MSVNKMLHKAQKTKNDEFYTQMSDIEKELQYYTEQLENKIIYCNCDNPFKSNFIKYFINNFNRLKLKKLIATCYANSENGNAKPYKAIITNVPINVTDIGSVVESSGNSLDVLDGDGDFRSQECVELLQQADIVVTNPPFPLFGEYVAQLIEYRKKFLIIGNILAVTYKQIFPFIRDNKILLGYHFGDMKFCVPNYYEPRKTRYWVDETGQKWRSLGNACWFTNFDHSKRHKELILYKKYTTEEYPHYDNYDAIHVKKTADIPIDYDGVMGVPITFLDKYNHEQFEIVNFKNDGVINGKMVFKRILIKNKYPCHTNL